MVKDIDLIAVGYPSLDRIIKLNDTPSIGITSIIQNSDNSKIYYGGCNVNIAYLGARLGLKSMPMMSVGADFESTGFKEFLEDAGIDLDAIHRVDEDVTSNTYLVENSEGHHITLFYPGAMDSKYEFKIDKDIVKKAKYGVITVGNTDYNMQFMRACNEENIPVVFGMKCDFKAFPLDVLKVFLTSSNIIFTNEGEREEIEAQLGFDDISMLIHDGNAECIVVTKGINGSEVIYKEDDKVTSKQVSIAKPDKVVDSTGVGDAYMTGFIYGLINGKTYEQAGRIGTVVSSFIIEEMGCLTNIPSLIEIGERYKITYEEEL
ncbi:carbohydrate kinase family protein [Brassicibacter mesophilus]|uniref:carbohydrate kinase family protein n=1 Tax=Brassicibacter mesophilus TaxID=745119 RepID=UPI003D1DE83A